MWKRRHLTVQDNEANVIYNSASCLYHTAVYQASPVDEFYSEAVKCPTGETAIHHVDPLIILFNQERLENLGTMGAKEYLDSMQQKEPLLAELRKNCTDEQLVSMLKSRYIQTPSEVMAYCRYIDGKVSELQADIERFNSSQSQNTDVEQSNNT